jgi:hypothetical protein
MPPQQEIEIALGSSTDCLRMAAQSLELSGMKATAAMLRDQAYKNLTLLLPMVQR